jgi:cytochrome c oxidase subunit 2
MIRTAAIVLAIAAALPLGSDLYAASPSNPQPHRIEIDAKRFEFDPAVITLKKGEPVILVVKSGDVAHGLRFHELGIELKAAKGGSAEVRFTPEQTGDFVGHCSVFCGAGHGHMTLTIRVVD